MPKSAGDHHELLKNTDLFADLDESSLNALCLNARVMIFRKNAMLMSEGESGESLFILKTGCVKIYVSDEHGHEIVLDNLGPGTYFGEVSLLDDKPRTASAITLGVTEVMIISKSVFITCISENPDIALIIIRAMTRRLRRATDTIRSLALENVYQRLCSKLKELSETSEDIVALPRKFSNQELGAMVGASREMVGKILKDLAAGGYIEKRQNRWILLRALPLNW